MVFFSFVRSELLLNVGKKVRTVEKQYEYDKNGSQVITKFVNSKELSKEITTKDETGNKIAYKKLDQKHDQLEEWTRWKYKDGKLTERNFWKKSFGNS